jgi:hypothetical protein
LLEGCLQAIKFVRPIPEPDAETIRKEVLKCVKVLQKQTELLYRRLYFTGIRLNTLNTKLQEKRNSYRDNN